MNEQQAGDAVAAFMALTGVAFVVVVAIAAVVALVLLAIQILILWFLMTCFQRIPPEHRRLEPGLVWLLLIPCFSLVWCFFVWPKLAQSFRSYFSSIGRTDVADCGEGLALTYCILRVASFGLGVISWIPLVGLVSMLNCLIGPACLVLLIILLVKASSLKNQIPLPGAAM